MLIAFDEYKYPKAGEDKPRKPVIVWLNPRYVLSVTHCGTDKFNTTNSYVTMAAREDEEANFSYTLVGDKDYIANIVNTALKAKDNAQS